jgi:serine/threonine protein kinase
MKDQQPLPLTVLRHTETSHRPSIRSQKARQSGDLIGPYRLLGELGRGGMGQVWLAERAETNFHQRVALKVIGGNNPDDELQARFLQERAILAELQHPNIASLIDGGLSAEGEPWFAMEYIEGRSIDHYINAMVLGPREIVQLARQLLDALDYAHRKNVVHRDLKPNNILVDVRGQLKVLDFGIAKLLTANRIDLSQIASPMTPRFAAPEQVLNAAISARADVYAVGCLLYQLLSNRNPYPKVDSGAISLTEGILRETPPLLSEALREQDRTLSATIRGDLERIVAHALEKAPEQRYQTARAMADDLDDWLQHRPLRSGIGTSYTRWFNWARKNAMRIVATTAVLSLCALCVSYALQQRRLAREANRQVTAIAETLDAAIAGFSPEIEATGGNHTPIDVLIHAGESISNHRDLDSLHQHRLLVRVAEVLSANERHTEAAEFAASAVALLAKLPAISANEELLAYGTLFVAESRRNSPVEKLVEKVLQLCEHPEVSKGKRMEFRLALAGWYGRVGKVREGNALLLKSSKDLTDTSINASLRIGYYRTLASLQMKNQEYALAERNLLAAISESQQAGRVNSPGALNTEFLLAQNHHRQGHAAKAIAGFESLIPRVETNMPSPEPILASIYRAIADADLDLGQIERAEVAIERARNLMGKDQDASPARKLSTQLLALRLAARKQQCTFARAELERFSTLLKTANAATQNNLSTSQVEQELDLHCGIQVRFQAANAAL